MRRCRLFFCIFIAIFILGSCSHEEVNMYQISETYRITSANREIIYLSVDLPISYGYQSIGHIEVLNADNHYFEQKDGYQTLYAHATGEGNEKTVVVNYEITLAKGNVSWDNNVKSQYLSPSEFIDSDNEKIIETAKTLAVENNEMETVKNISSFVSSNIASDSSEKINQDILLASEILANKKGVCGDYSNLMTALLRAAGIPAKAINGLVMNRLADSFDWSSPAGSHAWVEFYVDGKWYFDDPTWGDRYFLNPDGYHLSYGTQIASIHSLEYSNTISQIMDDGFYIIGAMTAPIKFIAWSEDEKATIVPRVDMSKK